MKNILFLLVITLIIGCNKQTSFSISESDSLALYSNNIIFTEIEIPRGIGYKFNVTPNSFFGVKTTDIKVLGGFVTFDNGVLCKSGLYIQGKEGFDSLLSRFKNKEQTEYLRQYDQAYGKGVVYLFGTPNYGATIQYNPIVNYGVMTTTNSKCVTEK